MMSKKMTFRWLFICIKLNKRNVSNLWSISELKRQAVLLADGTGMQFIGINVPQVRRDSEYKLLQRRDSECRLLHRRDSEDRVWTSACTSAEKNVKSHEVGIKATINWIVWNGMSTSLLFEKETIFIIFILFALFVVTVFLFHWAHMQINLLVWPFWFSLSASGSPFFYLFHFVIWWKSYQRQDGRMEKMRLPHALDACF